jgi:hypothetical protein
MSVLTRSSGFYEYTLGELIVVRVSANNSNGWGLTSTINTAGATARTIPASMSTPTRGDDTTESQI